jgi:Carboxypeptidase regulatory-like domain
MRGMLIFLFLPLILLIFYPADNSSAQTTASGGLTGVVTDPSGAVVPGAGVEIKDSAKGTTQTAKTDQEGVYRFFFVAPGKYALRVTRDGFRTDSRTVNILLGPPGTANVRLAIAKESSTVKVSGEASLLQGENGDFSSTMSQTQISELPNPGNDLTYIVQTTAGVVMDTDLQGGANFSILGMPGTSTLFTVNGMNDNDNGFNYNNVGSLNLLLGQNQIQEATVVSLGYSGQFGGGAGANVNYITKSGSNAFHGNAQYYWNGSILNANSWINNATGLMRPQDNANQWAGSFGGPIKKDKIFFLFDSEGLRVLLPVTFQVTIPSLQFETATLANIDSRFGATSASSAFYRRIFALYNAAPGADSAQQGGWNPITDPTGCTSFPGLGTGTPCARHYATSLGAPSADTLTSGRMDWNVSTKDRAFLQIQFDTGHVTFIDPINSEFDGSHQQPWWQGQLNETHSFNPNTASQFLLAGSYIGFWNGLAHPSQALAAFPTSLNFYSTGTFTSLAPFNSGLGVPQGRPTTQFQVSEDVLKTRGKQNLGFGANFQRIYWTNRAYSPNAFGSLNPLTLDGFYQGGVDPTSPTINYTQLTQSFAAQASQRIVFYNVSFYGQDEWNALPNLSLTLALRGEHYSNPVCENRCFARLAEPFSSVSHDPAQPYDQAILINQKQALAGTDALLLSPRFSFAWQPFGVSRNTVIRGGVGIFYDPVPGNVALYFSSNPPLLNSYTVSGDNLSPGEETNLFQDAAASNTAFVNGFNSGQTLSQIQAEVSGFTPPSLFDSQGTTHAPQYQRWSLEWQQTFGSETSLKVMYTGHHGIHEFLLDPDANAYGFGSLPTQLCSSPPVPPCADPRFGGVTNIASVGVSGYNGMVVSFLRRINHLGSGMFQANYTYGHALDEVSNGGQVPFTTTGILSPQDPNNLRGAYGSADYDVRHSLNGSYIWELPVKGVLRGHGRDYFVDGWQIAGTFFAHTGFPYTVVDVAKSIALEANNYFGQLYAVPTGAVPSGMSCGKAAASPLDPQPCLPPQTLSNGKPNPGALFVQSTCETGFNTGNLPEPYGICSGASVALAQGRDRFRGPGYINTDLTIMKNTNLPHWESAQLGLGFEFYNLFNHPNFGLPNDDMSNPSFGQISYTTQPATSLLGAGRGGDASARMIRLKLQLRF